MKRIYVRSQRAGERVMAGIERFLAKRLKLKVNKAKSAVAKPSVRKFLGFSFTSGNEPRRRIAPQAIVPRFKARVRELTRRTCGRSLKQIVKELSAYLTGWRGYFGFCQTPSGLKQEYCDWTRPSGGGSRSPRTRERDPVARVALRRGRYLADGEVVCPDAPTLASSWRSQLR